MCFLYQYRFKQNLIVNSKKYFKNHWVIKLFPRYEFFCCAKFFFDQFYFKHSELFRIKFILLTPNKIPKVNQLKEICLYLSEGKKGLELVIPCHKARPWQKVWRPNKKKSKLWDRLYVAPMYCLNKKFRT